MAYYPKAPQGDFSEVAILSENVLENYLRTSEMAQW